MKKILTIFLTLIFLLIPLTSCKKDDDLQVINLNEVTHSVFYAPLYIAMENGYFEEEGLKIQLTNGGGADNSMTAVLSGSADIGLMGPETVIYILNQGKKDAPKVFAQLTQKDGAFLVSRTEEKNFKWENLKDKEILAGRRGGVPAMSFEYLLYKKGLVNTVDYNLNYDVQFNLMTSAFIEGTADYCTVFEPTASEYQKQGKWHIVGSVGEASGEIPYTSFICLNSFINDNSETLKKFINALKKAMEFLYTKTEREVANSIVKQFPSTTIESIETSIKSYKNIDAWKKDFIPTESSFDNLQNIMIYSKELQSKFSFSSIVNTSILK